MKRLVPRQLSRHTHHTSIYIGVMTVKIGINQLNIGRNMDVRYVMIVLKNGRNIYTNTNRKIYKGNALTFPHLENGGEKIYDI